MRDRHSFMFSYKKDKDDKKKKPSSDAYSALNTTPAPTPVPTPMPAVEAPARPQQDQTSFRNACFEAVKCGRIDDVKKYINVDNVNTLRNKEGWPPLSIAVKHGQVDIAEYLLGLKADVHQRVIGLTPLHIAAINYKLGMIRLLLNAGADINAKSDPLLYTPLHMAIYIRQESAVSILVSNGAEVNTRNADNHTPVSSLILNAGHEITGARKDEESIIRMFKLLIDSNANIDSLYPNLMVDIPSTLPDLAVKYGRFQLLDLIVLAQKTAREASNKALLSQIEKIQTAIANLTTSVQGLEQRLTDQAEAKRDHSPRFGY